MFLLKWCSKFQGTHTDMAILADIIEPFYFCNNDKPLAPFYLLLFILISFSG